MHVSTAPHMVCAIMTIATTRFTLLTVAAAFLTANATRGAQPPDGPPQSAPRPDGKVIPLVLPGAAPERVRPVQDRIYRAAMRQAHYLLGTVHPWSEDPSLSLLTDSRSGEHWIRPNAGAIEGFAFLYRFGPYDERVVGVSRKELLAGTILPMMRYAVATHVTGTRKTGDGKPWGDAWQSAYWAQMLGRAAWFLWDDLPDDLRAGVRRVVAHEAERFVRAEPPHQVRLDTKAEENAWNSEIFSAAMLILPGDLRRPAWEKACRRWVMSSFLRPADEHATVIVDGRPVAEQFTGANIYDDFTLENHGFVHPDYMQCFGLSLGNALDYRLSGRRPPEAFLYNVPGVYENLQWFVLPDGGFVYPNGQDWTLFRNPCWLRAHLLMAVFGQDPDAWTLALRSLAALEKMQARSAQGAIFDPSEYFFASTQHDMFRSLGLSWLLLQSAETVPDRFQQRLGVRRLDAGKIILNRTPGVVHTFSWGARCMAQCVPYRLDRIVSPDQRSGIGHVRLKGGKGPLGVAVREARVTSSDDSFTAELVLDHGRHVRAELRFVSAPDGTWTMREKLVALDDVTTAEIATGLVGVLNDPHWIYETGRREVTIDGKTTIVPACSGKTLQSDAARQVIVDSVLRIDSGAPLHLRYTAATRPERGRATDRLYLNYLGGERAWKKGQVISEFTATTRCLAE